jgi:hypothetical protein
LFAGKVTEVLKVPAEQLAAIGTPGTEGDVVTVQDEAFATVPKMVTVPPDQGNAVADEVKEPTVGGTADTVMPVDAVWLPPGPTATSVTT